MTETQRDRLIELGAQAIVWREAYPSTRQTALTQAAAVVDAIRSGSGNGKAAERALKVILTDLEKTA